MTDDFRCGTYVAARIHWLMGASPGELRPEARAMLAQLRQASAAEPGTAPAVWPVTAEGIPELPETQRLRVEAAIHMALTQFATHQQGQSAPMYVPKQAFGRAVRRLAQGQASDVNKPQDSPIYRRFTAMSMATHLDGLLAHSRGIIAQLRSEGIGFDYARYADDLYWFQVPGQAASVHRRWGRDFHHLSHTTTTEGEHA